MKRYGSSLKSHINERLRSELRGGSRAAGEGISYDRYDEESGYCGYAKKRRGPVRLPERTEEELSALNGPVIVYKERKRGRANNE